MGDNPGPPFRQALIKFWPSHWFYWVTRGLERAGPLNDTNSRIGHKAAEVCGVGKLEENEYKETRPDAPSQATSLDSFQPHCLVCESLVLVGRRSSNASSSCYDFLLKCLWQWHATIVLTGDSEGKQCETTKHFSGIWFGTAKKRVFPEECAASFEMKIHWMTSMWFLILDPAARTSVFSRSYLPPCGPMANV